DASGRARKAPTVEAAVQMTCGILAGLEHLHTRQPAILHRDIKPENILLFGETPRLADFGISRSTEETHYRGLAGIGTYEYLAPETLLGEFRDGEFFGEYRIESDLWAVGILL